MPVAIDKKTARQLGAESIETGWQDQPTWSSPDGETIIQPHPPAGIVRHAVFLRHFILGQSTWTALLNHQIHKNPAALKDLPPECHLVPGGLILSFEVTVDAYDVLTLDIHYSPVQGLNEGITLTTKINLER